MSYLDRVINITSKLLLTSPGSIDGLRTLQILSFVQYPAAGKNALALAQQRGGVVSYGSRAEFNAAGFSSDVDCIPDAWFGADRYPGPLNVALDLVSGMDGLLFGGVPDRTKYTGKSIYLTVEGTQLTLDFSSANSLSDDAGIIQTQLQTVTGLGSATVTVVDEKFVIDSKSNSAFLEGFSANDPNAVVLGLAGAGAHFFPSIPAESGAAVLERVLATFDFDIVVFHIFNPSARQLFQTQYSSISAWLSENAKVMFLDDYGNASLVANETTSLSADVASDSRIWATWNGPVHQCASTARAAIYNGVDYGSAGSAVSDNAKQLPSIVPQRINTAGQTELDRKGCAYYISVGGRGMLSLAAKESLTPDVVLFSDWVYARLQAQLLDLLQAVSRLPQNDSGSAQIAAVVEDVMETASSTGMLAAGSELDSAAIAQVKNVSGIDTDGVLPRGWQMFYPRWDELPPAARSANKSVPFNVWMLIAGVTGTIQINLTLQV